jgi:hypothetical protein
MGNKPPTAYADQPPLDLAGTWVATRPDEWKNRAIGMKHSDRAKMGKTKVTYKDTGKAEGWVGDVYVFYKVAQLAPGQYSAKAKIPILLWEAKDGNLTVDPATGELEVRYPSQGIVEYWKRGDGVDQLQILNSSKAVWAAAQNQQQAAAQSENRGARSIKVVFRKVDMLGITWHWGICIGDSIYEVGGSMAVLGPNGVVKATGPVACSADVRNNGTKLSQFKGYVEKIPTADGKTTKIYETYRTDVEIEEFVKVWVKKHPMYNAAGPNCQTFTEDLFVYLTAENLPFAKVADLHRGPEASANAVWL